MTQPLPRPERPDMTPGYGIHKDNAGLLTWDEVERRMTESRNYWVSSTRADGRPHAAPVWGLWLEGAFYFSTDPLSVKGRNLAANPSVAVHLESGDDVVILEGTAERVTDRGLLEEFAEAYNTKYQFRPNVSDPNGAYYRLRLKTALAWHEKDFPSSSTRWRFA